MLANPTVETLRKLRFKALAVAYVRQLQDPRLQEIDILSGLPLQKA